HDLLVEAIRAQKAKKRGGDHRRVDQDLEALVSPESNRPEDLDFWIDLKDALDCFSEFVPDDATGFRLRFFFLAIFEDIADILDVTTKKARERYEAARSWLECRLEDYRRDSEDRPG